MKIKISVYLAIVSLLVCSCFTNDYSDKISNALNNQLGKEMKEYDYIFLIPNSGCTGCISEAEYFFKSHVDDMKIKFVFTRIYSRKELAIRLGKSNLQKKNVCLDYENVYFFPECKESMYPVVAKIKNGVIDKLENMDILLSTYK